MTIEVQMKDLLDAGVHFGHQVRRWNPKMRPFIYGERNGIHIINLQITQKLFKEALSFVEKTVAEGGYILCVATKKQAQEIIVEESKRAGMYYVHHRWLGGMMTNWQTVRTSISKLKRIEKMSIDGTYESLPKREVVLKERLRTKLERSLGGIKDMPSLPAAIFVIDAKKEFTAIAEANRFGIPVIAITDTNSDPKGVNYVVPGNDDSLKAIRFYASSLADAVLAGKSRCKADLVREDETLSDSGRGHIKVKRMKMKDDE